MLEISIVHLYADVLTACERCRYADASAACEWIEHSFTSEREAADKLYESLHRLLRWMELVSAVGHVHHITEWLLGQ